MNDVPDDFSLNRTQLSNLLDKIGGITGLKDGQWFAKLIGHSLRAFNINGNGQYFKNKYPKMNEDQIVSKLISVAARNAGLIGAGAGAAMTASEIGSFFTAGAAVPFATTLGIAGVGADVLSSTWIQLRLIAAIAAIYGPNLDPDDPEDVLLAIEFFALSKASDAGGSVSMKLGGAITGKAVKSIASKERLKAIQAIVLKSTGKKLLQRHLVKSAIPIASIAIGGGFNYKVTKAIGRRAMTQSKIRGDEHRNNNGHSTELAVSEP